jgi:hypothetical protein
MQALHSASVSPGWAGALPAGPDTRVKITEEYAQLVARDAYLGAPELREIVSEGWGQLKVPAVAQPKRNE